MTPDEPSARFYVRAILIVLAFLVILTPVVISYCRLIFCAWCREPWAIHHRTAGDLCRSCADVFDTHRAKIGHKRSILRRIRIWRTAA